MKMIVSFVCCVLLMSFSSCDRFKQSPQTTSGDVRIVCVSKQLTELLFALGAGNKIVAVDLSSTYPPEATKLPTVGYHRMLSAEGITSLNPTVVLHDGNVAPEAVITQLKKVGVVLQEFKAEGTIEATEDLIRTLGRQFNAENRADSLCKKLEGDIKLAEQARSQYTSTPKIVIVHFGRVVNNYLVMGRRGTATKILEWAGGVNGVEAIEGMKPITPELLAAAQPDIILATDFGFDRLGSVEKFKELPGIALTPAAKNNKIYRVEEHDLVYLGPRTGEIVMQMMKLIHQ
jgi:iron complex transport system substrate-binding protein